MHYSLKYGTKNILHGMIYPKSCQPLRLGVAIKLAATVQLQIGHRTIGCKLNR